jgi:hypothetical protein
MAKVGIKPIASNMTELTLADGTEILFSYETPVAAFVQMEGYLVTTKKWSRTTSAHIGKWVQKGMPFKAVDQEVINILAGQL